MPAVLLGGLLVLAGLVGGGFVGALSEVPVIGALVAGAGLLIGSVIVLFAVPGLVAAFGLLKRKPWAKIWTIAAGVLELVNVPLGTLFGAYSIWVVTRPEADTQLGRRTA